MALPHRQRNPARINWTKNRTVPVAAAISSRRKTHVANGCPSSQIPADPMIIAPNSSREKEGEWHSADTLLAAAGALGVCANPFNKSGKATPAANPVNARIHPGDDHSEREF